MGKIWHGASHWCTGGVWAPKIGNFTKISEYKRPTKTYTLHDFYQLVTVCGQLHRRSSTKIWADLLKGLGRYWVLNVVENERTWTKLRQTENFKKISESTGAYPLGDFLQDFHCLWAVSWKIKY